MGPVIITIVIILVISAVVGAISQFLNKVNDANAVNRRAVAANPRPQAASARPQAENPPAGKPVDRDMDRFLAEIDRLRRKNNQPAPEPPRPAPVVQPVKPPDRPRQRVLAEVAEPPRGGPSAFPSAPLSAFPSAPPAPSAPPQMSVSRLNELPVATALSPTTVMGMQQTRVTAPARRASATPKTDFGKAFASLLSTGKGAALAVVLQEVMGRPKSKRR